MWCNHMKEICSNKHHKVFVLQMRHCYLRVPSNYVHKSSMDKSFSSQKKTLTLLKSIRFSHKDLSISELLFLCCSHLWAIAHCLVFATRWRYLGIVSVGLCYHWTSLSSSGKNKEPTRLALFALCVLKMKSMYQATTKFSCSCIPLRWWLPVSPSTFSFISSKSVLHSS